MEFPQTYLIIDRLNRKLNHNDGASLLDKCLPKECSEIMSSNNCSCVTNITDTLCPEDNPDSGIPYILCGIHAFIMLVLLLAIRFSSSYLNNFIGTLVFFMGIVSSVVTQLCTVQYWQEDSSDPTVFYNMFLGIVSIIFTSGGYFYWFQKSPVSNIGSHDAGMGIVVAVITGPLFVLESTLIIIIVYNTKALSYVLGSFLVVWAIEKVNQVFFYVWVRKCTPSQGNNNGVIFYFRFLSFVNFTMWLNSIPFTDIKLYDEVSTSEGLWLVDRTFKALAIDYRLLFSLLFFEHALSRSEVGINEHAEPHLQDDEEFQPPPRHLFYVGAGIGLGISCLALETLNALQFWIPQRFPEYFNFCPIMVDVILAVCGVLFLHHVGGKIWHNKKLTPVLIMVSSMGAVSIVYLMILGVLCVNMLLFNPDSEVKENHSYVAWSGSVFFFRGVSLLVLLVVYTGVHYDIMESADNHNNWNYFFTWALFGGLLARFVGSCLDEFYGTMHKITHHRLESQHFRSLKDLFNIGPLFQLASCLHLSLHFLLMIIRLHKLPKRGPPTNRTADRGNEGCDRDDVPGEVPASEANEGGGGSSDDRSPLLSVAI